MSKKFLSAVRVATATILTIVLLSSNTFTSNAKEPYNEAFGEPFLIKTTAYCQGHTTATGVPVREGICAVAEKWLGYTVTAYQVNDDGSIGKLLGYWECLDTGKGGDSNGDGIGAIEEGYVIDMYFDNLDRCKEWMKTTKGKIYVQITWSEG